MAKKIVRPTEKIRLQVVDINHTSNTITLEGASGDLRYAMMIDAELNQKMTLDAVVGDMWDITLYNAVKLDKPKKGSPIITTTKGSVIAKGSPCPATGSIVKKSDVFVEKTGSSYYTNNVTRTVCPECAKKIAVNGGYSGKPYTMRKHNV